MHLIQLLQIINTVKTKLTKQRIRKKIEKKMISMVHFADSIITRVKEILYSVLSIIRKRRLEHSK